MQATIMVVDDDPAINSLISHQLRGLGYRTVCLYDGMQALQQFVVIRPDLVLLDVMMPCLNGWDICRQIRASSAVPIILLTAKDADADVMAGFAAGADDYIMKPFRIAQLHARIEATLNRAVCRPDSPLRARGAVPTAVPSLATTLEMPVLPERQAAPQTADPRSPAIPRPRPGPVLRDARRRRGLSLYQAERECRVRWDFLQAVEEEQWDYIPSPQRRAVLRAYAGYLGVTLREPRPQRPQPGVLTPLLAVAVLLVMLMAGIYFL